MGRLRERRVHPLAVGRRIVASWEPMQDIVLETVRELGLELQIVFNKGAVMVLPSGVNKASGLVAALAGCGLSPHNVVGIGDAENDHAFLAMCGCSVAVANALDSVKAEADLVTSGARGDAVRELIKHLLASDLADVVRASARHQIPISAAEQGDQFFLRPNGGGLLVAGVSGGGKSTLVTGVLERLTESGFQFCVIDPEGDYSELEGAVVLGDARQQPRIPELLEILRRPDGYAVVNMLDVDLADRPTFLDGLLTRLSELRAQTGRPHWIVLDEAHHLVPASRPAALTLPRELQATILVTVHPDQLAPEVLSTVETVAAVGDAPARMIRKFCTALGVPPPPLPTDDRIEAGRLCCGSAAPAASRPRFGWSSPSCSADAMPATTARASLVKTAASTSAAPRASCPFAFRTSRCSCRSRPGWTIGPGCTTSAPELTRPGFATRSTTRTWPTISPPSSAIAGSPPPIAERASRRRLTVAIPGRPRKHPAKGNPKRTRDVTPEIVPLTQDTSMDSWV